ncbi:hypothetical protein AAE02nite_41990 [Adhaeribacter aerolatus]|uniref:DUF3224 domain-containing protein n=1 Tax=Adhaeribacter aerolatus TaxID=670289 RepID=A0A512B3J5_9BACT|nr:DUF3224 domain-containing protein [Adhaeribacter aerolatus]GEO06535.1 hypothetical protein AAE02nite_41990 [Adhaeribacter aerolatus]
MKKLNHFLPVIGLFLIAVLVIFSSAWVPAIRGCHKINAKGNGIILSAPTEVVTVTEAEIIGGGLLHGTTRAEFTSPVTPDTFIGTLVFTTRQGTLAFEINNGHFIGTQFFATAVAIEGSGTGKLAGATGTLVLEGVVNPTNGSFTEDVTGEICFD